MSYVEKCLKHISYNKNGKFFTVKQTPRVLYACVLALDKGHFFFFWMFSKSVLLQPRRKFFSYFGVLFRGAATIMSKPKVFFDITAGGTSVGRIVMEVGQLAARLP